MGTTISKLDLNWDNFWNEARAAAFGQHAAIPKPTDPGSEESELTQQKKRKRVDTTTYTQCGDVTFREDSIEIVKEVKKQKSASTSEVEDGEIVSVARLVNMEKRLSQQAKKCRIRKLSRMGFTFFL